MKTNQVEESEFKLMTRFPNYEATDIIVNINGVLVPKQRWMHAEGLIPKKGGSILLKVKRVEVPPRMLEAVADLIQARHKAGIYRGEISLVEEPENDDFVYTWLDSWRIKGEAPGVWHPYFDLPTELDGLLSVIR